MLAQDSSEVRNSLLLELPWERSFCTVAWTRMHGCMCIFCGECGMHSDRSSERHACTRRSVRSWLYSFSSQTAYRPMTIVWRYFHTSIFTSRRDGPEQSGFPATWTPGFLKWRKRGSWRIFGNSSVTFAQWWRARHLRNLIIRRSLVRFRPQTR